MTPARRLQLMLARRSPIPEPKREYTPLAKVLAPDPTDTGPVTKAQMADKSAFYPGSTPEVDPGSVPCGRFVTMIELIAYGRSPEEGLAASRKADEEAFGTTDPTNEGPPTEGQETGVKFADSWLERWLALQATRDAANQAVPEKDALTSKFLGGPLSLGLAEAASNHLTLGDTVGERRKNLTSASQAVRYGSYPDALRRGLSTLPAYAGAGAVGGAGLSVGSDLYHGRPLDGTGAVGHALAGAGVGSALSLARPVLQKLILDNVSNRARRKAIRIKADSPLITSLPFGDMTAAALHPHA